VVKGDSKDVECDQGRLVDSTCFHFVAMTCPGDEVYPGSSLPEVVISKDRMFIAKEILRTETTYVAQLKEIVEVRTTCSLPLCHSSQD